MKDLSASGRFRLHQNLSPFPYFFPYFLDSCTVLNFFRSSWV